MTKITIIIDHPASSVAHPQKITMEGVSDFLPPTLEFLELALRCMGYQINGKLEIVENDE